MEHNCESASVTVPIIDLGLVLDSSPETAVARQEALGELAHAARDCGVFAVANHGFPPEIANGLLSLSNDFFELPKEAKEKVARGNAMVDRGYRYTTFPSGLHESFFWNEDFDRLQMVAGADPGNDPWPPAPARFKEVVRGAIAPFKELSRQVYRAVALSVGLRDDALEFMAEFGSMQLHHYDPGTGLSAHADLAPLTIIFADDVGLECKFPGERWATAPSTDGVLCCMLGDAAMYLTNDRYTTAEHRVTANPRPRCSVLWAPICGPDAKIGPLPELCSISEPARYEMRPPEVVVRDWLTSKQIV